MILYPILRLQNRRLQLTKRKTVSPKSPRSQKLKKRKSKKHNISKALSSASNTTEAKSENAVSQRKMEDSDKVCDSSKLQSESMDVDCPNDAGANGNSVKEDITATDFSSIKENVPSEHVSIEDSEISYEDFLSKSLCGPVEKQIDDMKSPNIKTNRVQLTPTKSKSACVNDLSKRDKQMKCAIANDDVINESAKTDKNEEIVDNISESTSSSDENIENGIDQSATSNKSVEGKNDINISVTKDENDVDSHSDESNDEGPVLEEKEETAKPASNILKFFSKCEKPVVTKAEKQPLVVKALVHPEPSPPKSCKTFDIFSKPKRRSGNESNVAVHVDLDVICIEEKETAKDQNDTNKKETVLSKKRCDKGSSEKSSSIVSNSDTQQKDVKMADIFSPKRNAPSKNKENKNNDDVTLVKVENEELIQAEQLKRELVANQLEALDKIKVSATHKTSQATLSFGKTGVGVGKPVKPSPVKTNKGKTKATESPVKGHDSKTGKNKRKSKVTETPVQDTEESPIKARKRKRGRPVISDHEDDSRDALAGTDEDTESRSEHKGGAKLKIVLGSKTPRGKKSKSKTDQDFTPKSLQKKIGNTKVTKAKRLIEKAKLGKRGRQKKHTITTPPKDKPAVIEATKTPAAELPNVEGLRRSSRRSCQLAKQAIQNSIEEIDLRHKLNRTPDTRKREDSSSKRKTKTPSKKSTSTPSKTNTPSKKDSSAPVKKGKRLASIFMKKSAKTDKEDEETDDDVVIVLSEEDKQKMAIKKSFLFSGVPETLKKQIQTVNTSKCSEYPPFPVDNHIQQVPEGTESCWNLRECALPLKTEVNSSVSVASSDSIKELIDKDVNSIDMTPIKSFTQHKDVKEELLKLLLAEINTSNMQFPVKRTYRQLLSHKQDTKKSEADDKEDTNTNPRKRKILPDTPAENAKKRKIGDESDEPKRRLSLRTRAKPTVEKEEVPDVAVIEETKSVVPVEEIVYEGQWTEKYAPSNSSEIVGHVKTVKKLKNWLSEWKRVTCLEMRRLQKEMEKEAKRKRKKDMPKVDIQTSKEDSDSDFDFEDSDSDSDYNLTEDEDTGLCNTTLITGPHGIGKTCMVYSLAQELGYKIFEVNASSKRSGKHVLTQLQEATQSHQVANKNLEDVFSTILSGAPPKTETKEKPAEKKKMPTAFSNFLQGSKKAENKPEKEQKKRGRKKKDKDGASKDKKALTPAPVDAMAKKGLDLSSVSLILFDEADVVFEEDKAFWAAIQTFMKTTKRPIILTATDPKFASKFDPKADFRMELCPLKTPPLSMLSSYLQVLCLVENIRTDLEDIRVLLEYCKCDLRKAILTLQFLVQSGGTLAPRKLDLIYNKSSLNKKQDASAVENIPPPMINPPPRVCDTNSQNTNAVNSEDDFEEIGGRRKKRKALVFEDESSMDSFAGSPMKAPPAIVSSSQDECSQDVDITFVADMKVEDKDLDTVQYSDAMPCAHQTLFEGATACSSADHLFKGFMHNEISQSKPEEFLSTLYDQGIDFVNTNHVNLFPLPRLHCPIANYIRYQGTFVTQAKPKLRRIKNNADIFDSDCEDEQPSFLALKSNDEQSKQKEEQNEMCVDTARSDKEINSASGSGNKFAQEYTEFRKSLGGEGLAVVNNSMREFSRYYDNVSYFDAYCDMKRSWLDGKCVQNRNSFHPGSLNSGLGDNKPNFDSDTSNFKQTSLKLSSTAHALNVSRAQRELNQVMLRTMSLKERTTLLDKISLPIDDKSDRFTLLPCKLSQLNSTHIQRRALEYVYDTINPKSGRDRVSEWGSCTCSVSKCAISMDYMPTLRLICKSEQVRKAMKTKRRFLHYLDQCHIGFKESIMDILTTTFS